MWPCCHDQSRAKFYLLPRSHGATRPLSKSFEIDTPDKVRGKGSNLCFVIYEGILRRTISKNKIIAATKSKLKMCEKLARVKLPALQHHMASGIV